MQSLSEGGFSCVQEDPDRQPGRFCLSNNVAVRTPPPCLARLPISGGLDSRQKVSGTCCKPLLGCQPSIALLVLKGNFR